MAFRIASAALCLALFSPVAYGQTTCRLSTADCATVEQERLMERIAVRRYVQNLHGLSPIERERAGDRFARNRFHRRSKQIPERISEEWARMYACETADEIERMTGQKNNKPFCR